MAQKGEHGEPAVLVGDVEAVGLGEPARSPRGPPPVRVSMCRGAAAAPGSGLARQQARLLQALDRRIERAFADGAHMAGQRGDALAQLIAVQRSFVEESQDGEFEHARILPQL